MNMELWVSKGPNYVPSGVRPASDAEVLAAAATLDGAEVDWRCVYGNPLCKSVVFSVGIHSKCGPVLVISLPDKETTDE